MLVGPSSPPVVGYDPKGVDPPKPVAVNKLLQPKPSSEYRAGGGTKNYFRDQVSTWSTKLDQLKKSYMGDRQDSGYQTLVQSFQDEIDRANYALSKAPEKPGFDFYT